ncbi:penicillin acylase family protein [Paucibacter sp. XJ19-41]|uniref:penicillin acylase family protein n=1 Tax=Paucibacter sp. XJ19-41 TaxID=2927824 RepID=UPI002349CEFE|nr:penicillin acylase family protein [Paucibacter sp. XJ19-41]MDC6169764.1 penicillin acylase family protein [Paucibacter sp. XJ19-41]
MWNKVAGGALALLACVGTPALAEGVRPTDPLVRLEARTGATLQSAVEIRRTTDGVPHVKATSWRDLGHGHGYVQAQDALCTLADGFVTFEGRRSLFFGPSERPAYNATFGRSSNLELDIFFKAFAGSRTTAEYRRHQPGSLNEMIDGFAEGYNHYLAAARAGRVSPKASPACLQEPWVRAITGEDILRRMVAANLAAGYAHFIPEIVKAGPPGTPSLASANSLPPASSLSDRLSMRVGEQAGLGSNVLAIGGEGTGGRGSVLFGNPHWFWGGPDRFYQVHLTIPGQVDVSGVSFLGIPVVMIGFNRDVAWSHTVSAARRFGLFELALTPVQHTSYRYDGADHAMQTLSVSVEVRDATGTRHVNRTLYRTPQGPLIDLGGQHPAFGWAAQSAIAIRDVNETNWRIFSTYFKWSTARSLDEFVTIQRRELSMPWVNTVAIGRGDNRVWYGDVGAIPNVPDELRTTCTTPLAQAFAGLDPFTPFLDGSRSMCEWRTDASTPQPGILPAEKLPGLFRTDYVANMNDSYWLANVRQPLEGYAAVLGGERQALSLRGRAGHRMAGVLLNGGASTSSQLAHRLMQEVLAARAHSADLYKDELLARACAKGLVDWSPASPAGAPQVPAARRVDVRQACNVLRRWTNTANVSDRGALLWDSFWLGVARIPASELYAVPFSATHPLETPRTVRADPRIAQALAAAVVTFAERGWALDATRGSHQFARTEGRRVPVFGGCHFAGYFTVACTEGGSYELGPPSEGNSYLQVVSFPRQGVDAFTALAHGLRETAVTNGSGGDALRRYARKDWLRLPFEDRDIDRDPSLDRTWLRP